YGGIYVGDGGPITTIATQHTYSNFGHPSINDSGTVAFWAQPFNAPMGIFTGPDPVTDKVIRAGDLLFGSTVTDDLTNGGQHFLNNHGQLAMPVTLADGRHLIVRADPVNQPTANDDSYSVTENTTLTMPAPGVLANDTDPNGASLTASLVSNATHGTLTL